MKTAWTLARPWTLTSATPPAVNASYPAAVLLALEVAISRPAFLASRGLGDDMNAMASLIAVIQKELTLARGEIGAEAAQPQVRQRDVLSFSVEDFAFCLFRVLQNVDR